MYKTQLLTFYLVSSYLFVTTKTRTRLQWQNKAYFGITFDETKINWLLLFNLSKSFSYKFHILFIYLCFVKIHVFSPWIVWQLGNFLENWLQHQPRIHSFRFSIDNYNSKTKQKKKKYFNFNIINHIYMLLLL